MGRRAKRYPEESQRGRARDGKEAYRKSRARDRLLGTPYGKQGHIFCFCCCDTRRATILVGYLHFCLCIGAVALTYLVSSEAIDVDAWFEEHPNEDDHLQSDVDLAIGPYVWALYTYWGLSAFFALLGMAGAIFYESKMVLLSAFWTILCGILSLVFGGWGGIGVFAAAFFAFPNFMFNQEMTEGIMTDENYPNEEHSCCCVGHKERELTIKEAIENRLGVFS